MASSILPADSCTHLSSVCNQKNDYLENISVSKIYELFASLKRESSKSCHSDDLFYCLFCHRFRRNEKKDATCYSKYLAYGLFSRL